MPRERWRWVVGYKGLYMASDQGRVMSVPHDVISGPNCGYVLKQNKGNSGYLHVCLRSNGNTKTSEVHRLVAKAFIKNPKNKEQVNHKDGNKTNNTVENLEWVTRSENALHSYRVLGRKPAKAVKRFVKLDREKIIAIYNADGTYAEIAREFGVSDVMVRRIKLGISWKEITCQSTK